MKVLKLFGGLIGGAVALLLLIWALLSLARFIECRPDSADVKVMKPMAEKISDYIVTNGIPKSLKEIPDLPYGLVGCERDKENSEKCYFNNKYSASIYILYQPIYRVELFSEKSKTGMSYDFNIDTNGNVKLEKKQGRYKNPQIYSFKTNGICTLFKQ